jgi:proton-dependent oligopeptide transporter, POT family
LQVYAEKYVGFWLSFLLPTALFLCCPVVMFLCRNIYVRNPPTGSVLSTAAHLIGFAMKGKWGHPKQVGGDAFWDAAKPSNVANKPKWMTFDDAWVEQVRRGLNACAVFTFLPIWWLSYAQVGLPLLWCAWYDLKLTRTPDDQHSDQPSRKHEIEWSAQ